MALNFSSISKQLLHGGVDSAPLPSPTCTVPTCPPTAVAQIKGSLAASAGQADRDRREQCSVARRLAQLEQTQRTLQSCDKYQASVRKGSWCYPPAGSP